MNAYTDMPAGSQLSVMRAGVLRERLLLGSVVCTAEERLRTSGMYRRS